MTCKIELEWQSRMKKYYGRWQSQKNGSLILFPPPLLILECSSISGL